MPLNAAENLAMSYQQQLPDSLIVKSVTIGPNKMFFVVAYSFKTLLYRYDSQGAYGRTIIFHTVC